MYLYWNIHYEFLQNKLPLDNLQIVRFTHLFIFQYCSNTFSIIHLTHTWIKSI